ncbi:Ankyrin repeat protein [Legionella gratiana]|uniref:Ankyrin repeat protein n=2 Tax=Legionella gratiana TaxID=45066 RepID=A0A378JG68_9GAMM|nr:Ankyrin repeat protein [Legionella gratiana]STX45948.1 Ankyrin repeat protein [Legionella gratiana]
MYRSTVEESARLEDNLLTASRDGKLDEVMRLVQAFPDLIHSPNVAGNTPLHLAVIKGQVEIIEFLLKNGAKIDAVNNCGLTPFCESLLRVPPYHDHYPLETFERIVKLFIEAGLDLNETAHISKSYLGDLAFSGALEASKILVANGADINIQDQFGFTPLHSAACGVRKGYFEKEQAEVGKWLISIGADKNAKTNDGKTALDFAKKFEHSDLVNLLKPHSPYPFFLQHLKVESKQLADKKVANALWLSDKDVTTTNISKSEFGLWAEKKSLCFNQDNVEESLSQYVMKK